MAQLETVAHAPVHTGPGVVDERSSLAGLRAVATFEAGKGIVVVALMLVLLAVHNRVEDLAWDLLYHLHIDPERRYAEAFLKVATRLSDARLWTIALAGLTYSTVRFVEAWGLWNRRVWAEWFALLSGTMYLPWEVLKFMEHRSWQHVAIIAVNMVIVLYMLYVRVRSCRAPAQRDEELDMNGMNLPPPGLNSRRVSRESISRRL